MTRVFCAEYCNQVDVVGGDLVTVYAMPRGGFRHVIFDSCGHGPRAARVKQPLELVIGSDKADPQARPSELARRLNDTAADGCEFTTGVILDMVPDDDGLSIRYANGGHFAPVVVYADGILALQIPEANDKANLPFGISRDTEYAELRTELRYPLGIVTFTDGIVELPGLIGNRRYVVDVVADAVRTCPGEHPDAIVDQIRAVLRSRIPAGQWFQDDASLAVFTFVT